MTFQQIMQKLHNGTLTNPELQSWLQSGTATHAQIQQFLHGVLTSDNHGSWLDQIAHDLQQAPGAAAKDAGIHNPITDITHFFTSPDTWIRGGEILAGAILLIAGVMAIMRVTPSKVASASKVAML